MCSAAVSEVVMVVVYCKHQTQASASSALQYSLLTLSTHTYTHSQLLFNRLSFPVLLQDGRVFQYINFTDNWTGWPQNRTKNPQVFQVFPKP